MKNEDIQMDILREQKKANKEFEKMARNLSDIAIALQTLNRELHKYRLVLDKFDDALDVTRSECKDIEAE